MRQAAQTPLAWPKSGRRQPRAKGVVPETVWLIPLCGIAAVAVVKGAMLAYLILGLAGGAVLFLIFGQVPFPVMLAWPVLAGIAYPFVRIPQQHAIVTFDRVWISAMMASLFAMARPVRRAPLPNRLLCGAMGWLVAAYGLRALTTSGQTLNNLLAWVDAIVLPGIAFLVARKLTSTTERARQLGAAFAAGGAILALVGIAQWFLHFDLARLSGGEARFDAFVGLVRVSGPFSAPEPYAIALIVCLAGTLFWTISSGRAVYPIGYCVAALECVALGFTLFRAAWISAIAVVVIVLGIRPKRAARALSVGAAVAAIVLVVFFQVGNTKTVSTRLGDTENVSGRLAVYRVALRMFEREPLFGVGVNQFVQGEKQLPVAETAKVRGVLFAHSSYMNMLAEQGLFGFVPLMAVTAAVWYFIHDFRRRARDKIDVLLGSAVLAATVAYFFMSITLTLLPYGTPNVFLLLMLGAACTRNEELAAERAGHAATAPMSVPPPALRGGLR